ncbi:MAG: cell division protein FtsQ/DivIB [Candidatus Cyclobacteriaceae bacterium M2_1C_046]
MKSIKVTNTAKVVAGLFAMIALLSFSAKNHPYKELLASVQVIIQNNHNNHYLDEGDIINSLYNLHEENNNINLKDIELRLKENPYIKNVQVYKDLKENLMVNVELRRPMARLIRQNKSHAYISYDGYILPTSAKYNTRVPLISGEYSELFNRKDVLSDEEDLQLYYLLNYIEQDEFLKAQIAQIDINKNMYITLYPQVTKQIIEFGKPEGIEDKFKRLRIFYRQILPRKGWNSYERVNLDFEGQIIAE